MTARPPASGAPSPERSQRERPAGMLGGSVRIFTIAGIDIGIHLSWLVVFGLVTWSLAVGYLPAAIPGIESTTAWILGAIASLLLFASVLVHELAHSFVARAQGLEVHSITLFIFGGVSNLSGEAKRPSTEFLVAIVGPLTSVVVAALAYLVGTVVAGSREAAAVAGYLATVNLLLGLFNLVPGFPLDGGRVLRAIAWTVTGSIRRGTRIAVTVGQVVAWALMLWGIFRVFGGDVFGGIWIAAIGWFLQGAGQASLEQVVMEQVLRRVRVRDVAGLDRGRVPPSTSVADLIERYLLPGNRRAMAVAADDGALRGIVTLGDVTRVPPDVRDRTPVADVMTPVASLVTARPDEPLADALEALGRGDWEQLPVVRDGRLVGLITRADILRQLQLREALGVGAGDDAGSPSAA
ncbi:MAG TPA: site-2 protease family protein [Candidatus Limnocylindrales bacterium]|nr:site-2 protease family protein [Candidatus Limnocylindrales bacterium]